MSMSIKSTEDQNKETVKNAAYYAAQLGRKPISDLDEVHNKIQAAVDEKKDKVSIYGLGNNQVIELEKLLFIVIERPRICDTSLFIIKW